jgi:hypothetical protein
MVGQIIMKVFTYSEARKRLARVLDMAWKAEILIKRRGGETFSLTCKSSRQSPFDAPGLKTRATTRDILEAVAESRSKRAGQMPLFVYSQGVGRF